MQQKIENRFFKFMVIAGGIIIPMTWLLVGFFEGGR